MQSPSESSKSMAETYSANKTGSRRGAEVTYLGSPVLPVQKLHYSLLAGIDSWAEEQRTVTRTVKEELEMLDINLALDQMHIDEVAGDLQEVGMLSRKAVEDREKVMMCKRPVTVSRSATGA